MDEQWPGARVGSVAHPGPRVGHGSVQGLGLTMKRLGDAAWSRCTSWRLGWASIPQERSDHQVCGAGSHGLELRRQAVGPGDV